MIMATFGTRIRVRMRAGQLDQQIETGARGSRVPADSALAAHLERITSRAEREQLAAALLDAPASHLIDELARRLHDPSPVHARGMARLRMLLADRRGPFYRPGPGSLNSALQGVLAAL